MTTTTATTSSTTATAAAAVVASAASTAATASASNASVGESILTSLNANGSNIDTDSLVTNLTAAQKTSVETPITTKQTANTAQISSLGSISSDLTTFATSLNTLVAGGTLQTQPVSSSSTVMTVAAVAGTAIGSLSDTISVGQLAAAQQVKSSTYASAQAFNLGTLSLTVAGGSPVTINVTSSNDTLSGIAQSITAAGAGVTASVITGSNGQSTLVLKGQTGAAQSFQITGADTSDGSVTQPSGGVSLSALSYDPTATGANASTTMTSLQAAQDAQLTVDGVAITRSSNSFSDVIPGVQMTLTGVGSTSLSSTPATAAISEAVTDFVSAYNSLLSELTTATAAATSSSDAGPLRGNSAIRSLQAQLAKLTTTPLNASGSIRTLAELGVSTAQDGTLSVDTTKLSTMLATYPNDVAAMFMTSQTSSSSKVLITNTAGAAASGVYAVSGLTSAPVGGNATGSINGTAMTASSWNLTATPGNNAAGLMLQILSGAPSNATITVNQGLGGALQAVHDALLGTSGALTTLSTSLTTQQTALATALSKADAQVTVYHDQLVTKFTQMNTLISGYKATSSYLTQQVDLWTNSNTS